MCFSPSTVLVIQTATVPIIIRRTHLPQCYDRLMFFRSSVVSHGTGLTKLCLQLDKTLSLHAELGKTPGNIKLTKE